MPIHTGLHLNRSDIPPDILVDDASVQMFLKNLSTAAATTLATTDIDTLAGDSFSASVGLYEDYQREYDELSFLLQHAPDFEEALESDIRGSLPESITRIFPYLSVLYSKPPVPLITLTCSKKPILKPSFR